MKQLYFDIDSPDEIKRLSDLLLNLLSIDGIPTPKIIVSDVPDVFTTWNDSQ